MRAGKLAVFMIFGFQTSALCLPINCEALTHSLAPFQLTMKDSNGLNFIKQVYRSENLYHTEYSSKNGTTTKVLFQANFVKSMPGPHNTELNLYYNIPTDKYFFVKNIHSVDIKIKNGESEKRQTLVYNVIGDEDLSVGPCVLRTVHYSTDNISAEDVKTHTEIWMSVGIGTIIKISSKNIYAKTGRMSAITSEATGIETEFVPLK